ncbi:MAG: hypothetical protein GX336_03565 [Halanaerobiaceae bacterium]|nr:hypothetical protein [Halanaerobiaceae bacterium]
MKKEKALVIFLLFLLAFSSLYIGLKKHSGNREYRFLSSLQESFPVTTGEIELPLPVPSSISTEREQLRLDLEKIAVKRFFIVYSVVYGDQSHTAYHLYLTDLQRQDLDKEGLGEIYLQTETGEIIQPVAQLPVVKDFPDDQPLGWKIKIIAKFPYMPHRSSHDLILYYLGEKFVLKDISY